MKARAWLLSTHALALLLCGSVAFAQTTELGPAPPASAQPEPAQPQPAQPQPAQPVFTQQELDQMLAPIALYPDSLLSQILMASTYPIEVVQAARWSKANPDLKGDDAVRAAEQNNWDPSVKSLVAFPQVISMMDEKLEWMERLGDAFLSQQQQVMDTVQGLRQKAQAAGNLQSNENVRVEPQGQTIAIEQANPQVVYVPYYNPTVVYGPWWWADYPPVYWGPWPGYYARPGFGAGFFWGAGITIGAGFFFGAFDWPHRHVSVVNVNNFYYRPGPRVGNGPGWQHDPGHRRGVPYRDPALRQEFGRPGGRSDARREFRGNEPSRVQGPGTPAGRPDTARPVTSSVARPNAASAPSRPNVPNAGRPEPRSVPTPAAAPSAPSRPSAVESRPHIFEGVGQGATVRDSSARGRSSFQGMVPRSNGIPASRPGNVSAPRPGGNAARSPGTSRGNGGNSRQQR